MTALRPEILLAAHVEAESLRERAQEASRRRAIIISDLVSGGESAASVGTVIGVTRQRVAEIVKRAQR